MLLAHLSDLHLGRKSPGDPQGAERLNSLRQALLTLARHRPDAFVIAGDTFQQPIIAIRSDERPEDSVTRLPEFRSSRSLRGLSIFKSDYKIARIL